ncbi:MAG TPA: FimB/Mfa2 family fimbrial subunit [Candidatus Avirikenella pullistercoris]|nr:FimB/Mfa2 family fimbrial subunit [Candidatus Avirikenella pullistercoris]
MTERYTPQIVFLWVMILVCGTFTACSFHDDNDSCPMYVEFMYDYNMANEDKFAEQCGRIELFVFDGTGTLIQRIEDEGEHLARTGYRIPLVLSGGTYTLMAWSGDIAPFSYVKEPVLNSTKKEELVLRLDRQSDEFSAELKPLWNVTSAVPFTIERSFGYVKTLKLLKNTNRINLTLHGGEDTVLPALDDIEVKLTACNGAYHYDNRFADQELIIYRPFAAAIPKADQFSFSLSTLRLVQGQEVLLSAVDRTTGYSLLPSAQIDVIEYLLRTLPAGMAAQEYLDREDTWNIDLYLSRSGSPYMAVMIKINGWTVWNQSGSL